MTSKRIQPTLGVIIMDIKVYYLRVSIANIKQVSLKKR